ncbi:MAG: DUF5309 family protein [Rikenella sp.]|nr:DUF5309 family protein [Rikenella sp.]
MKKTTKILFCLGLLLTVCCVVGGTFDLFGALDPAGIALAFAAPAVVAGGETPTTTHLEEAGIFEQDISKEVTKLNPDRFPLDTILRNYAKSQKAESQEVVFYQRSAKALADTIATTSGSGLAFGDPACSYAYSTGDGLLKIYIKPGTPELWRLHDTLVMRNLSLPGTVDDPTLGAAGTRNYDVAFFVSGKQGDVLELTPLGGLFGTGANKGKPVVPDFDQTTRLYRMGQAKSEMAMQTDPLAIYPEPTEQYLQNFMAQIEEGTFHKLQQKKVDFTFNDMEVDSIEAMRAEMEMSMLFGEKRVIKNGNDKTYFTGGIVRSINKVLEYGAGGGDRTVTDEMYMSWLKEIFTGNSGSKERVLLAGSGLIKALELFRVKVKEVAINSSSEEYLGVRVTKIFSTFGTLRVAHSPLFDESGWEDNGLVLDVQYLKKREFVPLTATELDFKKTGAKNADAKVLQEVSGLTLRYPDCHAVIRPKA